MLLGKAEAVRLARFGIRVNMISPGWVDTEMTVGVQAHQRSNEMAMSRTPQRRWGTPGDFEGAAVFLASEASAFMTGAELLLDGGFSAG
jgi:2-deoxy-D-gluconate 3-dehydrogenase